jgi:peptidyl-prolyl cis-trans isomerase D
VERVNAGEALATIATELQSKVDTTLSITRQTLPQGLTESAVTQAFALAQGKAGSTDTADKLGRIVFKVTDIKPADAPTKEQLEKLSTDISRQIQIDAVDAYVAALQDKIGVTINESELRRMAGSAQTQ